jgi:hypothetical protein
MRPRAVQVVNQKEEDPESARQEKPFLKMYLARIIKDQVEELLEGRVERREKKLQLYIKYYFMIAKKKLYYLCIIRTYIYVNNFFMEVFDDML